MNANLIMKNIDLTIDVFNQNPSYKGKKIKDLGFNYIVGYLDIIKKLNEINSLELSIIIKELREEGGQYEDFSKHLTYDGVVNNNILNEINNSKFENKEEDAEIDKYELMYEIYKKHENTNDNVDFKKEFYENIQNYFKQNSVEEEKLRKIKKSINYNLLTLLEKELKHMNDDDFFIFINFLIQMKIKNKKI